MNTRHTDEQIAADRDARAYSLERIRSSVSPDNTACPRCGAIYAMTDCCVAPLRDDLARSLAAQAVDKLRSWSAGETDNGTLANAAIDTYLDALARREP